MLQRKQTLWLLLSLIAAILTYRFPFATGLDFLKENQLGAKTISAANNFTILLITGLLIGIIAITIFLYKNRKLQLKVCLAAIGVCILTIALYISATLKLEKPTISLTSLLVVLVLAGLFMAYKGIRHDEKLIKSLDKLR